MSSVYCMVTITGRNHGEQFSSLFRTEHLPVMLLTLGNGTASSEMLDYFGMESREKIVIFTVVTWESWRHVKGQMEQKLNIDVPGTGISFLIPVSSVGGGKALRYLLAGQEYEKEEESELKNTEYELLVVISNYGYNNLVMEAAREAGAGGGTVVHARGTGRERAEKFLGVTLAEEKEMTFIVTRTEKKNEIMKAIMEKAGMDSKAKSILFSLPVTETAGLRISGDWKG
ncbi:MAG TPA: P-II family nitrogen regulator [Candidatus Eisenbergiella pullistercoris]|uniref:P-II family nitrogen regulator n=1 Tax=Candidatus Eisenbergiella pullistercoris TaxID=2838555 RepID=A0A9D1YM36_9FIRM|nr:P-II family nitrogen regulator [Candidatus Eisenbergiella pullistercoris]